METMKRCTIDVLGTKYAVYEVDRADEAVMDARGKGCVGLTDVSTKEIMLRGSMLEPEPDSCGNLQRVYEEAMRREIVRAFLYESGMTGRSIRKGGYCKYEAIVAWMAIQFPKIAASFEEAGCL